MAGSGADWDLFQSLHAVLQAGSLSAAARRRGLTQPTLGRHIEALEQQLGAPLFLRSPRGLQPTDLALSLRPHLEEMAAAAGAALRDASGAADPAGGCIRLTASNVVGAELLPPILRDFRRKHPQIDLELVLSDRNEDLSRRDADIAVRMSRPTQQSLVARKIGVLGLGFYATPEYVAAHGAPDCMDTLREHTVIGFDTFPVGLRDALPADLEVDRALFGFRSDSDAAQLAALKAGLGVAACLHAIGRRHGLVRILPQMQVFELEMWLAMHELQRTSARMRLMFDHLAESLAAIVAEDRAQG
ncbi:MAG: LysR family transcriptional regulator [Phenylobacterium sp.]|uniref:LysR family transcriptional regulator n=1 Tax=Phenylobacterium sp. TaxID=1871053 RepID=UPI003919B088